MIRVVSGKVQPGSFSIPMSATATKTIQQRLREQIASLKRDGEESRSNLDFEQAFVFFDRAEELDRQLQAEMEGGVIQ